MQGEELSEDSCDTCHSGPLPPNLETERSFYTSMEDFRPEPSEIALSFVADEIPSELRRIVEFLNQQMDPAEVLAVEIKQCHLRNRYSS